MVCRPVGSMMFFGRLNLLSGNRGYSDNFSPITGETKEWLGGYSTMRNTKCVTTLLDLNSWRGFVDRNKAVSAIGSPTLNMWVASWNEKYPSKKFYCSLTNSKGYFIGRSSSVMGTSCEVNIEDNLYALKSNPVRNCPYWLASPSSMDEKFMFGVTHSGIWYWDTSNPNSNVGIRPVVCLKSDVLMVSETVDTVVLK